MMVQEARRIISYWRYLPKKQQPPESIWHSPRKCQEWIDSHGPESKGDEMLTFNDSEVERAT